MSVIILNGFIRYFNPMIPVIILPKPSTLPRKELSLPNSLSKPSSRLSLIIHSPKPYIFSNTNAVFSKKTVIASIFDSSLAHSSNSFMKRVAPSFVNSETKGPKRGCTHPKAPFSIFEMPAPKSDFLYLSLLFFLKYSDRFFLPAILSWSSSAS